MQYYHDENDGGIVMWGGLIRRVSYVLLLVAYVQDLVFS